MIQAVGAGCGKYGTATAGALDKSQKGTYRSLFGTDHRHREALFTALQKKTPCPCDQYSITTSNPFRAFAKRQSSCSRTSELTGMYRHYRCVFVSNDLFAMCEAHHQKSSLWNE